jgi:hypothetical protein
VIAPFDFDRSWHFDVDVDELWRVLTVTDDYLRWWTWLRRLDAPAGIAVGKPARCVVRAPLPYSLSFTVTPLRIEPARTIEARVDGDLRGLACLEIDADDTGSRPGCEARLTWSIELHDRMLRPIARLARPVLEWGHEWVVAGGVEQFRARALAARDPRS